MSKSILSMVHSRKAITSSALASYSLRRKQSNTVDSWGGGGEKSTHNGRKWSKDIVILQENFEEWDPTVDSGRRILVTNVLNSCCQSLPICLEFLLVLLEFPITK